MPALEQDPENHASHCSTYSSPATPKGAASSKLRSCAVCRGRKVRCDKQSPCSNCRRANVVCVRLPSNRPPRWARRLEQANTALPLAPKAATIATTAPNDAKSDVDRVMGRLRDLEAHVKQLRSQLEEARAAGNCPFDATSADFNSLDDQFDARPQRESPCGFISNNSSVHKQFGRLVIQDNTRSRYVSSGFWSRVNDELGGLVLDVESLAEQEAYVSQDDGDIDLSASERDISDRNAFLFPHSWTSSMHNFNDLHPLPSQVPFLLDLFSENVNFMMQIVHMPTFMKTLRDSRMGLLQLTPSNEALLFSIYFAAISSLDEDDVVINFGTSKAILASKFRLGFEQSLAKADFLNEPDMTLIQALSLFLCIVRRDDSPRYVYMMTGLTIRMAQYLGFHRDGSHFEHLTPCEVEMRRRAWWVLCLLDLRASEDQGTDLTIGIGSFDTKLPLNINDSDISPDSTSAPTDQTGITDMSLARISVGLCEIMRRMMSLLTIDQSRATLEEQSTLLHEIYQSYERGFLQYTPTTSTRHWFASTVARITMAKMTLIVFLPTLVSHSSPSDHIPSAARTKLLTAAIEVAEHNHALNEDKACKNWRWICQTYTHWHAIVYIMLEISRRAWSAMSERAWTALHSPWLIPAKTSKEKNHRVWVPLKGLMAKCRRHRAAEIERLRGDAGAVGRLEGEDLEFPTPSSPEIFVGGISFRQRWRELMTLKSLDSSNEQLMTISETGPRQLPFDVMGDALSLSNSTDPDIAFTPERSEALYSAGDLTSTSIPWLWDTESMDLLGDMNENIGDVDIDFGHVDWYNWIESAKDLH